MNFTSKNAKIPTTSVLLPVYNAEDYLRAAMESVLAQTYGDFELLTLDDGSTDNSHAILREYEASDNRVRVISRENKGLVITLNELISEARGKFLARMDADDICLPRRFEKQIAFMDANQDCVVVGCWVETMNGKGQPIGIVKSPIHHQEIDRAQLSGATSICHPSSMIRREMMITAGGYKQEFEDAEDLDLWLRLAEIGKIANLPEVLLQYRLHENSISEAKGTNQQQTLKRACEDAWQRRQINGQFNITEHWRPGPDKASRHKCALRYGWIAWQNNHRETWWTYACQALRLKPFSLSSWRLLIFGGLKSPEPLENSNL